MFGFQFHDTVAGAFQASVSPSGGQWARRMTGNGTATFALQLRDPDSAMPRDTLRALTRQTARCGVVRWNDTALGAWMVESRIYNRDTGVLTVNMVEIRRLFKERLLHEAGGYANGNLTITNRSAAGAVRAVLQRATQWGPLWALPLILPADGAGTLSFTWRNYQALTIEDCLQQIEDTGVEIDFHPVLNNNVLQWEVRVAPRITTTGADFPVTVMDPDVKSLSLTEDGSEELTGVVVLGNGTEEDMVTSWAGTAGYTIPVRDATRDSKDVRDPAQLQKVADTFLAEFSSPLQQFSFDVVLSGDRSPNEVLPGRVLRMEVRGDEFMDDSVADRRVIALSGSIGSYVVKPEVQ